jgi:acetyl esterase/lipase
MKTYARKLASPSTWRKIVTGRVNTAMVRKAVVQHETPADDEMAQEAILLDRFRDYEGDALFIYGANDPDVMLAARNYESFCRRRGIPHDFHAIAGANHSFYGLDWEEQVIARTEQWVRGKHLG